MTVIGIWGEKMINIYKANMHKLIKNVFFILGNIIAFAVTAATTSGNFTLPFLAKYTVADRMFFVSAAMVVFFSVFSPFMVCPEYGDGVIRNRIIAGYKQVHDYAALILTMVSAVLIMSLFYILGGVAGALISGNSISDLSWIAVITMIFATIGYSILVASLCYRAKNIIAGAFIGMGMLNLAFNFVMFGNALVAFSKGVVHAIALFIYNVNSLGQWFSNTPFIDDNVNPGNAVQMLLTAGIIVISVLIGTAKLERRDLK